MSDPTTETTAPTTAPTDAPVTQPTIDTSVPPDLSFYEPSLKVGTHWLLCSITMAPAVFSRDGGGDEFVGWSITPTLLQDADDDVGGKIVQGTKLQRLTFYTIPKDPANKRDQMKGWSALCALNNIPINHRNKEQAAQAMAQLSALPPEKRLPFAAKEDRDTSHYEQWNNTQVYLRVVASKGQDGQTKLACYEMAAASSTPK